MRPQPIRPLTPAEQQLVEANLPLVYHLAHKYTVLRTQHYERWQDLVGHLFFQLCRCAQKYKPGGKARFSTFALVSMKGSVTHYFRDTSWTIKPSWDDRDGGRDLPTHLLGLSWDEMTAHQRFLVSCLRPDSLDEPVAGEFGEELQSDGIVDDLDLEGEVVDRCGGAQVVERVLAALQPEEREMLELGMELPTTLEIVREIARRFGVPQKVAKQAWLELQGVAQDLYRAAKSDLPLSCSTGSQVLRAAGAKLPI